MAKLKNQVKTGELHDMICELRCDYNFLQELGKRKANLAGMHKNGEEEEDDSENEGRWSDISDVST